jgi:dihydroorotate dehydrogenase
VHKRYFNGAPLLPNLIQALYKNLLQPLLFTIDAETAHNLTVKAMAQLEKFPGALEVMDDLFAVEDPRLAVSIRSLTCPNPVGLAAGFDKNAELLNVLPHLGFGFIEVGTFTPIKQEGQVKPRLFRYKKSQAVVNRMGFNNPGVKAAALKLKARTVGLTPVGVNIGKGRDTAIEEATEDYLTALEHVHAFADYIVLNVSSPNTPNLRNLQQAESLADVLTKVTARNRQLAEAAGEAPKMIFTKVSPDCPDDQLEEIGRISVECGSGVVAWWRPTRPSILKHWAA